MYLFAEEAYTKPPLIVQFINHYLGRTGLSL